MTIVLEPCPGCRVPPGSPHGEMCGHALCPQCGEHAMFHECGAGVTCKPGPSMWHGISPNEEVARTENWWTTVPGVGGSVPDYMRVLIAAEKGDLVWDSETQRYRGYGGQQ